MSKPGAVIFDLGKVLLDFDYDIVVRRMAPRSAMDEAQLHSLLNQSPLLHRYETGLMSTAEFFAEVRRTTQFTGTLAEFGDLFGEIFTPIRPMIELHAALRTRGVPTFIFSNTNELAIRAIRRRFAFFADFDGHILSYEHRAMKPAAALYEIVEQATGRRGADLLYLDDRPENIATGQRRGWLTVLHETPEKSTAALRKSGLR